jgi:hypothetical protein
VAINALVKQCRFSFFQKNHSSSLVLNRSLPAASIRFHSFGLASCGSRALSAMASYGGGTSVSARFANVPAMSPRVEFAGAGAAT